MQTIRGEIAKVETQRAELTAKAMEREPFVRQLDGMIAGDSTLQTTIRDHTAYQRRYGMILTYPEGYRAVVAPGTLFAIMPEKSGSGSQVIVQEVPLQKLGGTGSVQNAVRQAVQKFRESWAALGGGRLGYLFRKRVSRGCRRFDLISQLECFFFNFCGFGRFFSRKCCGLFGSFHYFGGVAGEI